MRGVKNGFYTQPKPIYIDITEPGSQDAGSMRRSILYDINKLYKEGENSRILLIARAQTANHLLIAKEVEKINSNKNQLGTMDSMYLPFYNTLGFQSKEVNANDKQRHQDQVAEAIAQLEEYEEYESNDIPENITENNHLPIHHVLVRHCHLFEYLLKRDEDRGIPYATLMEDLSHYLPHKLIQIMTNQYNEEKSWKANWRGDKGNRCGVLKQITFLCLRYLSVQCYNCHRSMDFIDQLGEMYMVSSVN